MERPKLEVLGRTRSKHPGGEDKLPQECQKSFEEAAILAKQHLQRGVWEAEEGNAESYVRAPREGTKEDPRSSSSASPGELPQDAVRGPKMPVLVVRGRFTKALFTHLVPSKGVERFYPETALMKDIT